MDNYSSLSDDKSAFDPFELQFTSQIKDFLRETAKWATFLAILGFIFEALYFLIGIFYMAMGSTIFQGAGIPGMAGMGALFPIIGGVIVVMAVIFIFPFMYLLRFASNTKAALSENNTEKLTKAFENLKSHYKFWGIFFIIVVSFYVLFFVFGIIAAVAGLST
jgi:hypothetical protein